MNLASLVVKLLVVAGVGYVAVSSAEDLLAGITDSVSVTSAQADMKTFHNKFSEHYTLYGRYPNPGQELRGFLIQEFDTPIQVTIKDPWNSEYLFLGPEVEIRCCGPDKQQMTRDDLITEYPQNRNRPVIRRTGR